MPDSADGKPPLHSNTLSPIPPRTADVCGEDEEPAGNGTERPPPSRQLWPLMISGMVALVPLWFVLVRAYSLRHLAPSWLTGDVDTALIHRGLVQAPHLRDTVRWWTGPWVGQVPFYRPLTSYVFWFEWKTFGNREWLYAFPTAAAHLLATVGFAALAFRLACRYRWGWPSGAAVVAAFLFSGDPLFSPYRASVTVYVSMLWKNQPDALAAACCFFALVAYVGAEERGRWPVAAAGWYLAGCAFKEIAVPLPAVCLALEPALFEGPKRADALRRLCLMMVCGVGFLLLRHLALGTLGYTYGSNGAWVQRSTLHLLGPFGELVTGQWLGVAQGLWAFGVGILSYRALRLSARAPTAGSTGRSLPPPVVVVGSAVTALLVGWAGLGTLFEAGEGRQPWGTLVEPMSWAVGLLLAMQRSYWTVAVSTVLVLLAMGLTAGRHRSLLALGFIWTLAFLAPLALSPGPVHRYYLPECGYLLVGTCAATIIASRVTAGLAVLWTRASATRARIG
jgi:hypothetical protein